MLELRTGTDSATTGGFKLDPSSGRVPYLEGHGQTPAGAGRGEPLADVGDLHASEVIRAS